MLQSKAKEEAAKKAEAEAAKADTKTIGDHVVSLFDLPLLALLKDPLEPVLDIVADSAVAASAFAVLLLALPLSILYLLVPKVPYSTEQDTCEDFAGSLRREMLCLHCSFCRDEDYLCLDPAWIGLFGQGGGTEMQLRFLEMLCAVYNCILRPACSIPLPNIGTDFAGQKQGQEASGRGNNNGEGEQEGGQAGGR